MPPIEALMRTSPVIPVLVIEDAAHAQPIAKALVAGGLRVLEVTLRTSAALDVIREMKRVEGAIVGAGTVLNEADLRAALDAGSEFIVSPGLTEPLGKAAIASGLPFLPGTANASDVMRGLELGLTHFKFFPAEASGGAQGHLRSIRDGQVLPDWRNQPNQRPRLASARFGLMRRRLMARSQGRP